MRTHKIMSTAALAALMCLGATAANAKALVYSLEGSPENFNPALTTTNKAVWFTIAHSVVYEIAQANLTGYKVSPLGRHEFGGADLK
jgi:ABC-type transport system substrate-binding protein